MAITNAELAVLVTAQEARIAHLEALLVYNGVTTTRALGQVETLRQWLISWGFAENIGTGAGEEFINNLNWCCIGNWWRLSFNSRYYKEHKAVCDRFMEKLNALTRARKHACMPTKKGWRIVSVEPRDDVQVAGTSTGDTDIPL